MTRPLSLSFFKGLIPLFLMAALVFPFKVKASPLSGLNCFPTANLMATVDRADEEGDVPSSLTVCSPNPTPAPNPAPSPLPAVTFSHGSLDFGNHEVMKEGHVLSMTMTSNLYDLSQVLVDVNGAGSDFKAHSHCDHLPVGHSCEIEVYFTPHTASTLTDTLTATYFYQSGSPPNVPGTININPQINPQTLTGYSTVTLTGMGIPAASTCGDGKVDTGEECDDGNTISGDGCSATCAKEPAAIADQNSNPANAGGCSLGVSTRGEGVFWGMGLTILLGVKARFNRGRRRLK